MILPNFENVKINGGSFTYYMLRACCKYLAYVTIYVLVLHFNALCLLQEDTRNNTLLLVIR